MFRFFSCGFFDLPRARIGSCGAALPDMNYQFGYVTIANVTFTQRALLPYQHKGTLNPQEKNETSYPIGTEGSLS